MAEPTPQLNVKGLDEAFAQARSAGVGDAIKNAADDWGVSLLVLAFLTTALLRIAQGSTTVAMPIPTSRPSARASACRARLPG